MAENLTPTEYAVNFNSGAAYASETGDLIGGMKLVFGNSLELGSAPIIQKIMAGAMTYVNSQNKYAKAMQDWEKSDEKTDENKPKPEQSQELAIAQFNYEQLADASATRTKIFNNSYEQLTLSQAKKMSLYGEMPRETPETVIELVENNKDELIKNVTKKKKLKEIVNAFKRFHVLGNTARDIQGMHLQRSLEAIAA